jgi:hypothetical protein
MGWDDVSELRPPAGLLFIPNIIYEYGEPLWNDIDRKILRTSRKTCPSAILSTTWTDPGSNPRLYGDRPATNSLSHGTSFEER